MKDINKITKLEKELELLKFHNELNGRIEISNNIISYVYNNKKYDLINFRYYIAVVDSKIERKNDKVYIELSLNYGMPHSIDKIYFVIDKNNQVHETNSDWQIQF